ncbi:MAG: amidohydrolase 2 [Actinomycetia bacterium]|nr:amidohydrolase 2 [Actinomycetes bacterium]
MTGLGWQLFDADNHYYEAEDAFIRHMEPSHKRLFQWAEVEGRRRLLVNGRVNSFIPNPTFDPVGKPGALMEYFLGAEGAGETFQTRLRDTEPLADRPEYRDRDARLEVMDALGVEGTWLLPTLAVGMQNALRDEPDAAMAAFRAFNRWLDDDWGYDYQGRIFGLPYLALLDVGQATAELERVLEAGAKVVCMVPGPVRVRNDSWSPFTTDYDPFWARVDEAGITVALHGGSNSYDDHQREWDARGKSQAFFGTAMGSYIAGSHRDIADTVAAMVWGGLFERFSRLRIAVIENGSDWLGTTMKKLDMGFHQRPGELSMLPSETIRRHVWIAPFWEDDPMDCVEVIGVGHTLLGSDWPHLEGIPEPAAFADRLRALGEADVKRVMRDNALELTRPLG